MVTNSGGRRQLVERSLPAGDREPSGAAQAPAVAILVGCVSTNGPIAAPAADLYRSELFRRRRLYAERTGLLWWIVSAEYGLVAPGQVIDPYDRQIGKLPLIERKKLADSVADDLEEQLGILSQAVLELHAGAEYHAAIAPALRARGALIVRPLEGLL